MQPPDQLRRFFQVSERPIILIGASVRAAACSATLAGFDVLAIDLFGDLETRDACPLCLTIEQADQFSDDELDDLIPPGVPMLVVGGVTDESDLIGRLAKRAYWPGRQEQSFEILSRPDVLAKIATRSRVNFPSYRLASDRDGGWGQLPKGRWLVKSPGTSGGLGVRWADSDMDAEPNCYVQQWVPGKPYGAVFVANGEHECVLIGVSRSLRKRIGDCPFVYAGSHGPIRLSAKNVAKLNSVANLCVAETGYSGFLNIDVLIDQQDQMSLLEINPRWSASVEVLERPLLDTRFLKTKVYSLFGVMYNAIEGDISNVNSKQIEELAYETYRVYKRVVFAKQGGKLDFSKALIKEELSWLPTDRPLDADQRFERNDPMCTALIKLGAEHGKFSWRKARRLLAIIRETVNED